MARHVSSTTILAHRACIALVLFISLCGYYSLTNEVYEISKESEKNLESCNANAISILSTLQVFYEHKQRLSIMYNRLTEKSSLDILNLKNKLQRCESSSSTDKERLALVEAQLEKRSHSVNFMNTSSIDEMLELKKELDILKTQLIEKEREIQNRIMEIDNIQKSLHDCEKTIEQYVGVVPVAHYTKNESAFFQRKHKAGQALSFDRGAIQEHSPVKILSGAELMQKLKDVKLKKQQNDEEKDIHPDDRKKDDDYVNEIPNPEEADYKEGP